MKKLYIGLSAFASIALFTTGASAQTTVDFGVAYTQRAADALGGDSNLKSQVRRGVRNTNQALRGSKCDAKLRLRSIAKFDGTPNPVFTVGSKLGIFGRYGSEVGKTGNQDQRKWAASKKLDFQMWIPLTNAGVNGEATPSSGFSVIKHSRITQPTFPHEIGHNFSALHSHANTMAKSDNNRLPRTQSTLLGSLGRGYNDVANRYSNPNVKYKRATSGVAGTRENALRILSARVSRSRIK